MKLINQWQFSLCLYCKMQWDGCFAFNFKVLPLCSFLCLKPIKFKSVTRLGDIHLPMYLPKMLLLLSVLPFSVIVIAPRQTHYMCVCVCVWDSHHKINWETINWKIQLECYVCVCVNLKHVHCCLVWDR